MSYLSRVWMAASVAVVRGHNDVLRVHGTKGRLALAGLIPVAGFCLSRASSGWDSDESRPRYAEDSVRKAMYISCWAPS